MMCHSNGEELTYFLSPLEPSDIPVMSFTTCSSHDPHRFQDPRTPMEELLQFA